MIESLRIRDLGVIVDAQIRPARGLTVLTGETGAGKTMVLTGLELVLGGRGDSSRVRPGRDRASAEAVFVVDPDSPSAAAVREAGGTVDEDGSVVLVRTVGADTRSRAHAGGTAVPAAVLAAVGDPLVTVHGQASGRRLTSRAAQRELLDGWADAGSGGAHAAQLAAHRAVAAELDAVERRLSALVEQAAARHREQEVLRHGLAEVADVDPRPGEDAELAAEQARLAATGDLTVAVATAHRVLTGEGAGSDAEVDTAGGGASAVSAAAAAARALEPVAALDPALRVLTERAHGLAVDAADVAAELASYGGGIEDDPVRLAMVGERRAALARLRRRYVPDEAVPDEPVADTVPDELVADPAVADPAVAGPAVAAGSPGAAGPAVGDPGAGDPVLRWAADAERRLAGLVGDDDAVGRCRARRSELLERLAAGAARLTAARTAAAATLSAAVTAELADLAMPSARVQVTVRPRPGGTGTREVAPPASAPPASAQPASAPSASARPASARPASARPASASPTAGAPLRVGASGADEVVLGLVAHPGSSAVPLGSGVSGGELSRVVLALEVVLAGAAGTPTYVFDEVDAGVGGRTAVEVGRRLARLARTRQVLVVTHLAQVAAWADRHLVVERDPSGAVAATGVREVSGADRRGELARMMAGDPESPAARASAAELLATAAAGPDRPGPRGGTTGSASRPGRRVPA